MMSTDERLAYMADQIARNFATMGPEKAVAATADHMASFWDPRMRQRAFAMLDGEKGWLTEIAARAVRLLRERGAPSSQTQATQFASVDQSGRSDAG